MNKTKIIFVIIIALVVVNLVAGIVFLPGEKEVEDDEKSNDSGPQTTQTTTTQTTGATTTPPSTSQTIAPSELARHSSRTDCWIAYQNKVYDITTFLPVHPGGASTITPFCGTSSGFENAFINQHGTSQVRRLAREGVYKGDLQ